jgi:hypothetical protein
MRDYTFKSDDFTISVLLAQFLEKTPYKISFKDSRSGVIVGKKRILFANVEFKIPFRINKSGLSTTNLHFYDEVVGKTFRPQFNRDMHIIMEKMKLSL